MTSIIQTTAAHISFAAVNTPVDSTGAIGGDFWDVFRLAGDRTGILIGDFSGHGIEAAAHAALTKSVVRLMAAQQVAPAEAVTEINRFLLPRLTPQTLATIFLGVISPDGCRLDYASAGQEPPILLSVAGIDRPLPPTGAQLGIASGVSYRQGTVDIDPGDVLALFTDGLAETRQCGSGAVLGRERLHRMIRRQIAERIPLRTTAQRIIEDVQDFCGGRPQEDDCLLLMVRFGPMPMRSASLEFRNLCTMKN